MSSAAPTRHVVTKLAPVLDIDETSLSNWREIQHNDYGYIAEGSCNLNSRWACGARAWDLSQRAEVIKPTLAPFNAATPNDLAVISRAALCRDRQWWGRAVY